MAYIPLRMCAACRGMFPKPELIRLVRADGDGIVTDEKQKVQKRGVYLCNNPDCIALAKKKKALERQFKMKVGQDVYENLMNASKEEKAYE